MEFLVNKDYGAVQRRLRKGEVKFKKGDEILYYPKGKVILVGKKAEQAYRDFQAAWLLMKIFICLNTRNQK